MTGQEIIDKFELQVDDASELSSDESLDLANDIYNEVCDDRDWEWLKTTISTTSSTSVPYIALPGNFKRIAPNKDNRSVIFIGDDYQEYEVVSFADRRNYRDQDGFCYIDIPNMRLYFTLQPTTAKAVEYDYIKVADDLSTTTSPLFRSGFHKIISFGMAARFPSIEQAEKGSSYANENQEQYDKLLSDMATEDANVKLSL